MKNYDFKLARCKANLSLRAVAKKVHVNRSVITALENGSDVLVSNYVKVYKFYTELLGECHE